MGKIAILTLAEYENIPGTLENNGEWLILIRIFHDHLKFGNSVCGNTTSTYEQLLIIHVLLSSTIHSHTY